MAKLKVKQVRKFISVILADGNGYIRKPVATGDHISAKTLETIVKCNPANVGTM